MVPGELGAKNRARSLPSRDGTGGSVPKHT